MKFSPSLVTRSRDELGLGTDRPQIDTARAVSGECIFNNATSHRAATHQTSLDLDDKMFDTADEAFDGGVLATMLAFA